MSHDARDPRLSATPFMTDELVIIVPSRHPRATKRRTRPQDLIAETFIVAAQGAGTRAVVEQRLLVKGIVLPRVLEFRNLEGVKHAVEAGLGVSIQARSVVQREVSSGSLCAVKLTGMDSSIQVYYACRKNTRLTHAAKALVAALETGN